MAAGSANETWKQPEKLLYLACRFIWKIVKILHVH